jgi:predicted transcriptional regulator
MKKKVKNGVAAEPVEEYQRPLTFESVWQLFQETDKKFQETDRQMKETDKKLSEVFQELARSYEENRQMFRESDKRMKKLDDLFTSQWGKLIESLVGGDLIRLLNERGIEVRHTSERSKGSYQGISYEFDIIAENGRDVVFVEVKTTLRPKDVDAFIGKLRQVKKWYPKYRDNDILGAMAYLKAEAASGKMAENKGLFVICATGSSACIINPPGFKPKAF